MDKIYVEYRDGVYYIAHTRVTLNSLVYAYREGHSPETIAQAFWLDHDRSMVRSPFIWHTGRRLTSPYVRAKPNRMPSASNSADIPLRYTKNLQRQSVPGE